MRSRSTRRKGPMTFDGDAYYFAAQQANPGTFILLAPASARIAAGRGIVWGCSSPLAAGGLLAALAAFLLARRISRPVDRIAAAARTLARRHASGAGPGRGRDRDRDAGGRVQRPRRRSCAQAQEAERNFLLSVSHELKTPLTAIRGYAEAVEDGAVDPRDAAATVAAEARRLERLVEDLLDLARMNRTDFSVHNTEIDLAEVAEDAVRRYGQQAQSFGVTL